MEVYSDLFEQLFSSPINVTKDKESKTALDLPKPDRVLGDKLTTTLERSPCDVFKISPMPIESGFSSGNFHILAVAGNGWKVFGLHGLTLWVNSEDGEQLFHTESIELDYHYNLDPDWVEKHINPFVEGKKA